jgi:tetratricopeptide (TPR) repeat protein
MQQEADFFFKRSDERFRNDDIAGGTADLDQAIILSPDNLQYLWQRALWRYQTDAYEAAIADFNKIIGLTVHVEDLESAYSTRALCYERLGKYEALIKDLDWLIEHGFGTETTYSWRGDHKYQLGYFEDAVRDFTEAHLLAPDSDDFLLQRAHANYQARRYEDALRDFTQVMTAAEHHPNYLVAIYHWRGMTYFNLSLEVEALEDFHQEMRLRGVEPCHTLSEYLTQFAHED